MYVFPKSFHNHIGILEPTRTRMHYWSNTAHHISKEFLPVLPVASKLVEQSYWYCPWGEPPKRFVDDIVDLMLRRLA